MKRILLFPLILLALAVGACSDDRPDEPTPIQRCEIATILDPGAPALLEVQNGDDAPAVSLSANVELNGAEVGQRVLLYYSVAVADTLLSPRPIKITGIGAIPYCQVEAFPLSLIEPLEMKDFKILSSWTTGKWLNLQMTYRTGGETSFLLVADEATLDDDEVKCYFVAIDKPEGNAYVDRKTFASFDVSGIITRPGQRAVITTTE